MVFFAAMFAVMNKDQLTSGLVAASVAYALQVFTIHLYYKAWFVLYDVLICALRLKLSTPILLLHLWECFNVAHTSEGN